MWPAKRIRQQKALAVAWNLMHLIQCHPNTVKPSSSWSVTIPLKTSTTMCAFTHFFAIDVQNQSPTATLQEHLFCRVHRRPSASRLWFTQLSSRVVVPILMQTVTIRVVTPCSPVGQSNSSPPWNSEIAQHFLTNVKFVCGDVAVVTLCTPSADTAWTECC